MRTRVWLGALSLLVVASIVALTPMAYASPPDPSWVRGMYDDADFDDVVNYITSASSVVSGLTVSSLHPLSVLIVPETPLVEDVVPLVPLSAHHLRSPPAH